MTNRPHFARLHGAIPVPQIRLTIGHLTKEESLEEEE